MMTQFTPIDLDKLPLPNAVKPLDIEQQLEELKQQLIELLPDIAAVLSLESEPSTKLLELLSYQATVFRQQVNNAFKATMLATATSTDLDHRVADYNVKRLQISPADNTVTPPIAAIMESDTDLRRRAQMALEGFSTAGPEGAYIFHTLSAHGDVLDASANSPEPGIVDVYVLSRQGNGTPIQSVLDAVTENLNDDDNRPLTDQVRVKPANIIEYSVQATLYFSQGPDKSVALAFATKQLTAYRTQQSRLGNDITRSGIFAALHVAGVERVDLSSPSADILMNRHSAPFCTAFNLIDGGYSE